MANLRADNLTGTCGRNDIDGSLFFELGDRLQVPSSTYSTNFNLGGDFTIEGWIKPSIFTSYPPILHLDDSTNSKDLYINFRNGATLGITNDSTVFATSPSFTLNEWAHFAVVRNSNSVTVYCNGVGGSSASCTTDFGAGNQNLYIGMISALSASDRYRGYMSNLRIVKGTALYTANFTPPTEKLTAVDGTVLLCCQDSDDPTQEATGKTITGYGRYFAATGEKFANTGFTADSDWTKGSGWTISGGLATHAQGSAGDLAQQISGLVVGQTYKLSVDILTTDNDVAYFFVDNNPGGNYPPLTTDDSSPVGYHQIFFEANATTMNVGFRGSSLWAGTLTNLRLSSADHGKAPKVLPPVGVDEGVVFDGDIKVNTQNYMYFPTGDTSQRGRGRGLIGNVGGEFSNGIHYVQIQTSGNSIDFGDTTIDKRRESVVCSATRGIFAGGDAPSGGSETNVISYVTIATTGNAVDYGDLTAATGMGSGCSSNTRGVIMLGYEHPTAINTIDYVTIATTGNAADFGDSTEARNNTGSLSSPTRGIFAGGSPSYKSTIDYVTIASTGNATDFGDFDRNVTTPAAASNGIRGVFAAGGANMSPNQHDNTRIEYITIATTGNSAFFGDLTVARGNASGLSNSTTAVIAGGSTDNGGSTATNSMEFITIATNGNGVDFGDTTATCLRTQGSSDSHGGLS